MQLIGGVNYSLGSDWVATTAGAARTYTAVEERSGAAVASVDATAPLAPNVFTLWLLGDNTTGVRLLPLGDAPETGRCE